MDIKTAVNYLVDQSKDINPEYVGMTRKKWTKFTQQVIVFEKKYNRLNYLNIPMRNGWTPNLECLLADNWILVSSLAESEVA